jgi:hypothetical protein
MATIKLTELRPAGSDLFEDSESFLNELTNDDINTEVYGGLALSISTKASPTIFVQITPAFPKFTIVVDP